MRVVTRHLAKEILISAFFVLFALVFLFGFFDLVAQASNIGTRYDWLSALEITLYDLPAHAYQVMPVAGLLAGVYTLSRWAAESEFTILRISGLSSARLALMLLVPGFVMVMFTYGIGEYVAPYSDQLRVEKKIDALKQSKELRIRGYTSGMWVRDVEKDKVGNIIGHRFINVKYLIAGESTKTRGWRVFDFDEKTQHLKRIIKAPTASYIPNEGWHLTKARVEELPYLKQDEEVVYEKASRKENLDLLLRTSVTPEILAVMTVRPVDMGIESLHQYVQHLKENRQTSNRYEVTFWNRIFYPITIFVMLALSMPFAYLNVRSGGISVKIFVGIMVGIVYYAFNNIFSFLGGVTTWPPFLVAVFPTLLMLTGAFITMYFVEKR